MLEKSLKDIDEKYEKELSEIDIVQIEHALKIIRCKREKIRNTQLPDRLEFDEESQEISELLEKYKRDIKQYFINKGLCIGHITDVPLDKMDGRIKKSISRLNNYELERGDFVFAFSISTNGKNPYIARKPKDGMYLVSRGIYFYGGDNIEIKAENGEKRCVLTEPNYIYKISPKNFEPVVTLLKTKEGKIQFAFSNEWISREEVDLNDKSQFLGIEEITDVTELLKNFQIFTKDCQMQIAVKVRRCKTMEEALKIIVDNIEAKNIRYINGEARVNYMNLQYGTILSDYTYQSNNSIPDDGR